MSVTPSNRNQSQSSSSYRWVSHPRRFSGRDYHEISPNASERNDHRFLESPAIKDVLGSVYWMINKIGLNTIAYKAIDRFDSRQSNQSQDFRSDDIQSSW